MFNEKITTAALTKQQVFAMSSFSFLPWEMEVSSEATGPGGPLFSLAAVCFVKKTGGGVDPR